MNTTASNLANSSNTADTEEAAYKAKRVVFRTLLNDETIGDQTRFAGSIHIQNITDDPTLHPNHMIQATSATRTDMCIRAM